MKIRCGKQINSQVLKSSLNKEESCIQNKLLCENLTKNPHSCFICGGSKYEFITNIYGYNYVKCLDCSTIYINNPPTQKEIENIYASRFYDNMTNQLYANPSIYQYRVENIAEPKVDFVESIVQQRGKWFDIGCGTGEILYAAKESGWAVAGVETNDKAVAFVRDKYRIEVEKSLITQSNASKYLCDSMVVSLFGVLEHLFEPTKLISLISNASPCGSYLVIEVPHFPSISCFSQIVFPRSVNRIMSPPLHLMIFTLESLEWLLNSNGYRITNVWYFGQDFYELISTLSLEVPQLNGSKLQIKLLDLIDQFQRVIDESHYSDEILVVAIKE